MRINTSKLTLVIFCLSFGTLAFAENTTQCQVSVQSQMQALSEESDAQSEDKGKMIDELRGGSFNEISEEDAEGLVFLLESPATLAFTFNNDAGTWLVISDGETCEVIDSKQVQAI